MQVIVLRMPSVGSKFGLPIYLCQANGEKMPKKTISVRICKQDGLDRVYKIATTAKMSKLMDVYCEREVRSLVGLHDLSVILLYSKVDSREVGMVNSVPRGRPTLFLMRATETKRCTCRLMELRDCSAAPHI